MHAVRGQREDHSHPLVIREYYPVVLSAVAALLYSVVRRGYIASGEFNRHGHRHGQGWLGLNALKKSRHCMALDYFFPMPSLES